MVKDISHLLSFDKLNARPFWLYYTIFRYFMGELAPPRLAVHWGNGRPARCQPYGISTGTLKKRWSEFVGYCHSPSSASLP